MFIVGLFLVSCIVLLFLVYCCLCLVSRFLFVVSGGLLRVARCSLRFVFFVFLSPVCVSCVVWCSLINDCCLLLCLWLLVVNCP